jgi:hypothetical protein
MVLDMRETTLSEGNMESDVINGMTEVNIQENGRKIKYQE